jgi:predicted protein tyrosine phosphatase
MTQLEALEKALWLAITAKTKKKSKMALDLANDLAYGIKPEQIEILKAKIERAVGGHREH